MRLEVGDFLRVSAVPAPNNTEIIAPNDFNIVAVLGKRGAVEEEVDEAVEGEEAAAETDSE